MFAKTSNSLGQVCIISYVVKYFCAKLFPYKDIRKILHNKVNSLEKKKWEKGKKYIERNNKKF
jgi:coenzyme F420-reducing hydrogenase beta subunit